MTLVYSQSNVSVRNDANVTDDPAVLVTGDSVTLRNAGYLDGKATGTVVRFSGGGTTFINEALGNVSSDFFRSAIVGSDHADTIINEGRIRGRVELGTGDDVYIERKSSAEVYFGAGNDRFDFVAGDNYQDMYNLSLRLDGGIGTDTLNLSGYGLKLNPIIRDFEHLNVTSTLAYLSGVSGFQTINLAAGGFYELAYSLNPNVDLSLKSSLSLRGSSSLRSITGSDAQEELRLSGNVRISGDVHLGAGTDFVTIQLRGDDPGTPQVGGLINGGEGTDQLSLSSTGSSALTVDLSQFRSFENINVSPGASTLTFNGASDASTLWLAPDAAYAFEVRASKLDLAAVSGTIQIAAGGVVASITGPGGHSRDPSDSRLLINNNGNVLGDVRLSNGDDVYNGGGTFGGTVYGFFGNDILIDGFGSGRLDGGDGDDTITGGGGDDVLIGGGGNDAIMTVAGNVAIKPDAGFDRVDGGDGVDTLALGGFKADYQVLSTSDQTFFVTARSAVLVTGVEQGTYFTGSLQSFSDLTAGTPKFSALSYIAGYSDLRAAFGTEASAGVQHFATYGFAEGRTLTFNALDYIASYSDLRAAYGTNVDGGAQHFIKFGANEGRTTTFDGWQYLASYGDLIQAFGPNETAAARHFIQFGANENRAITFNAAAYAAANADLAAVFGSDAEALARHYVVFGYAEGRSTGDAAVRALPAPAASIVDAFVGSQDNGSIAGAAAFNVLVSNNNIADRLDHQLPLIA